MRKRLVYWAAGFQLALAFPSQAASIRVELQNRTPDTVYVVTAFASDLIANNRNLTRIPLPAGGSRVVTVFDDYNRCIFTFTVNFNRPIQPGRKARAPAKPFRVFRDIDICRIQELTIR